VDKIEISKQVFDNLIYTTKSLLQIIATKDLSPEEVTKLKYLTKLTADDIAQLIRERTSE